MSAQNQVTLIGRLTRDPDIDEIGKDKKYTKARLCLAIKNIKKKVKTGNDVNADFIDGITVWGNQAKFVEKYLTKGRMILVQGELLPERWKDSSNKSHYRLTVVANTIQALDSAKKSA